MTWLHTWSLPRQSQDQVIIFSQLKHVGFIDSIDEELEKILSIQWTWCQVISMGHFVKELPMITNQANSYCWVLSQWKNEWNNMKMGLFININGESFKLLVKVRGQCHLPSTHDLYW